MTQKTASEPPPASLRLKWQEDSPPQYRLKPKVPPDLRPVRLQGQESVQTVFPARQTKVYSTQAPGPA